MRLYFIFKEYVQMATKCLVYIYRFDKKATLARLGIFLAFPIIGNALAVANARLTDSMQQNFGTGLMSVVIPIFIVVVGIEIVEELITYMRRVISAIWRSRMQLLIDVERNNKKMDFSIPFIDSRDYSRLDERIRNNGGTNAQLDLLLSIPDFFKIMINVGFAFFIVAQFNYFYAIIVIIASLPHFYVSFQQIFATRRLREDDLDFNRTTYVYNRSFMNWTEFKDSKIAGSLKRLLKIFKTRKEESLSRWQKLFIKYARFNIIASLTSLLVSFWIQYLVIKHTIDGSILIGQATLIILQVNKLMGNIDEFSWFLPDQYDSVITCKYLFLFLHSSENTEKTSGIPVEIKNDSIEFKKISFTYPVVQMPSMHALTEEIDSTSEKYFGLKRPVEEEPETSMSDFKLTITNLKISKGERVAIVGKNGNGKTTFLQILMHLYPVAKGTINLFGNNINEMSHFDVHKHFSMLFQDYSSNDYKTHEYIGLANIENPDMERVKAAAKIAEADEFIEKWKDGYTTQLGISFKGVKPSKGQWQKLALARTFYKDAPIIILDEPTAAIDAISSKKIFENLSKIDKEKILIFVSHNISDVPLAATRVLVFDQGKIVGDGPHHELLETCSVYKELYDSEKGV